MDETQDEEAPLLPATRKNKQTLGLLYTGLSALLFSAMSVLVKQTGQRFPSTQIVFIRSLIQLFLALISSCYLGIDPWGSSNTRTLLILRGSCGALSLGLYFFVLINMPLGDGKF